MVWRTAQRLHAALAGGRLRVSDLRWPSLATVDLTGRRVTEVVSAGKHILTRLSEVPEARGPSHPDDTVPLTLHSHLRMEGSWYVHRTGSAGSGRSLSGIRAVLATDRWTAVGHKLGMLDLVPTDREHDLVGHLGPDLLGPDWDTDRVVATILTSERPIGEVLLDQRVLAGVGTFYMSEALFLRGMTPWTPAGELDRDTAHALVELLHRLLHANRDRAVQVTTGDTHAGRRNWVHARSGRGCLRCGTGVRVDMIGTAPTDRTAFYCPSCQRGPNPDRGDRPQAPLGARRRPARDRLP